MRSAACAPVPNSSDCLTKTLSNLSGHLLVVHFQKLFGVYSDNKAIYEASHLLALGAGIVTESISPTENRCPAVQGLTNSSDSK
jgi:hypothetical protein